MAVGLAVLAFVLSGCFFAHAHSPLGRHCTRYWGCKDHTCCSHGACSLGKETEMNEEPRNMVTNALCALKSALCSSGHEVNWVVRKGFLEEVS
jgi:hypothetical protein